MLEQGLEINATFTGINRFCPENGPCVPQGEGEWGWKNFEALDPYGAVFRVKQLSWPEAAVPGIIMDAREAFRKGKREFKLRNRPHVFVVAWDQIPVFVEGLTTFLEHQASCPNRRCP